MSAVRAAAPPPALDPAVVEAFRTDGAVALRGAFTDWVETLRAGLVRNMAEPGPFAKVYTTNGAPGGFFGDYCNWDRIPEYRSWVFDSPAASYARSLMGSKTARFFHEHVIVKEPGTREPTPWHHDLPYYCVEGQQSVSMWVALDPVPKSVCVEYVAGSHAWGKRFLPRKFSGVDYDRPGEVLEPMPDLDAMRDQLNILSWDLEPGDAIAFHFLTLHGAPGNLGSNRRRGFAARWVGDDAVFALRSGEVSPPFPGVADRLKDGEPLSGPEFPLVP
ncbi:phytanoyl-CoA dioxygenase family protein [Zavarzinia sp. CC-PAN008]|uniref:phytanoyl-CoA dioxygenase family protein n=1 Tax=Zavarzinia sp. CC-PAN008 TaxID=3243332 RepID=UPI003F746A16